MTRGATLCNTSQRAPSPYVRSANYRRDSLSPCEASSDLCASNGEGNCTAIDPSRGRHQSNPLTVHWRVSPSHSTLENLRPKSRAIRVNPEGQGLVLCTWPRSITVMTNKKKVTNWSRDDTKRNMVVSIGAGVLKCRMDVGLLIPQVAARPDRGSWKPKGRRMSVILGASCICPKNEGLANPGASRTEENSPVRRCSVGHLDPGRPSGI